MLRRFAPTRPGAWIAAILTGAWRDAMLPLSLPPGTLVAHTSLLLELGAGGLGWRRVRDTELGGSPAATALRQAYRLYTLQAGLHTRDLVRTLTRLWAAGVEPLLAKGWAVARLYPEPGLRLPGDIDLCVRPEQYGAAVAALASPEVQECDVDLHRGLHRQRYGQAFSLLDDRSLEAVYEHSQRVPLGEVEVRVLGPEDHLRLLCLHMLSHGACRPLWLCDIGAVLESRPADFDWEYFLSGDGRRAEWAVCALGLAHELLGARLEGTPIEARASRLPGWLVPAVLRQWGRGFQPLIPLVAVVRQPAGALKELRRHWPNPIEATIGVRGPFNTWPRLPFQVGAGLMRSAQFLAHLTHLGR